MLRSITKITKTVYVYATLQGKRNPSKMVGTKRRHQRADRLKPQSQKTSQSDHRTTVLSNSMKLSNAMWGHPRRTGHGGEV